MIKTFLIKAAAAALAVGMLSFFGCSDSLNENNNMAYLLASKTAEESVKYGSITISTSGSRALDVDSISSAVITITGNGIDTPVTKTVTGVTGGKKENITIEKIPVGKNRIISVQACSDDNGTVAIADAVIRAVKDITTGINPVTVTWSTSRKGYIYNALYVGGVNVSELTETEMTAIDNATPDCDATNIDLVSFVADFKTGYANLKDKSAYILSSDDELKRVVVEETDDSTEAAPKFSATAYFTVSGEKDVTASAKWVSTKETVATVDKGAVTLVSEGETVVSGSYTYGNTTKTGAKQTINVSSVGGNPDKIYLVPNANWQKASAKMYLYMWKSKGDKVGPVEMTASNGKYVYDCDRSKFTNVIFLRMNPTGSGTWDDVWNRAAEQTIPTDKDTFTINDGQWGDSFDTGTGASGVWSLTGSYGDGTLTATVTPEIIIDPTKPTVTISPASGEVSVDGTITIEYKENYATVTAATVTITGEVSKSYALADFTDGKLTLNVKTDLGITEEGKSIVVNASATNSEGTGNATPATLTTKKNVVAKNTFTWDNVNCYFVLTDRFYNGDKNNDGSYGRVKTSDGVGSFHGGDIKGLTEKLDYFNDLGVNAIWISAPYEQMHGWTSGKNDGFAHYAFHGYYTLDWTFMDQSMGTIEEFRTFVNEAHKRGIRVVMDVVLNHTGYDNWQDMIDYGFGGFQDSYSKYNHAAFATDGKWKKGDGSKWGTNWDTESGWLKWWAFWVRGFGDKSWAHDNGTGYWTPASSVDSDPLHGSLAGLPDVATEKTATVNLPTFLKTKWNGGSNSVTGGTNVAELNNNSSCAYGNTTGHSYKDYQLPTVSNVDWYNKSGNWRTDGKGAQTDYQIIWLSGWVREFGVDGFRCDTAKHVDMYRWGQLKDACESALAKWRADSTKEDTAGAKEWKDNFWMTGEAWGHGNGTSDDYYSTGKFDSMINFSFQGNNETHGSTSCGTVPTTSHWSSYNGIGASTTDTDSNGNCNSTLSYLSSHDTGLLRHGDSKEVGTMFILLPAGIQIYYGDESWRSYKYSGCGDSDMQTRGDMNWNENAASVTHWGKVGKFRKFNPAVGAGAQTTSGSTYIRKFTKTKASGIESNSIAISLSSTTLSGLPYSDGTTVYNWYDGKSAVVSGGSATFTGSSASTSAPVLCSDRNPADYGVKF